MKYLLDTCVISEFVRKKPSKKVVEWLNSKSEDVLYVSVLTIGEIQKGISKLPSSKKKLLLQKWLDNDLLNRFENKILDITTDVVDRWGRIQGEAEQNGKKLPVIDSLIAATAFTRGLTVVTRNVEDIARTGIAIRNPWE